MTQLVEFASPRFAGDPVLEEVLNSPDAATVLHPASPRESVARLQQALWDLSWVRRVRPRMSRPDFVIGTYGRVTIDAVTAYGQHYGTNGAGPTGFAGGRTLAKLDRHCLLLDAATAAAARKVDALLAAGARIEPPHSADPYEPRTVPVPTTNGAEVRLRVDGDDGHVYVRPETGAFAVHGRLDAFYRRDEVGGPAGLLGFPVADAMAVGDRTVTQRFEGGELTLDTATGRLTCTLDGTPIEFGDPRARF